MTKKVVCTCQVCGAIEDAVIDRDLPSEWAMIGPVTGPAGAVPETLACQRCLRAIVTAFPGLLPGFDHALYHDVEIVFSDTKLLTPSPIDLNGFLGIGGLTADTRIVRTPRRIRTATSIREIVITDPTQWEILDVMIGNRSQRGVIESDRGHAFAPLKFPLETAHIMMDIVITAKFLGANHDTAEFHAVARGRAQGATTPTATIYEPRRGNGVQPFAGDLSGLHLTPRTDR